jgi:hypothetical protein
MLEPMPPYLRSIRPPYRLRPRSAVAVMPADEDTAPGFMERLRRFARQVLSSEAQAQAERPSR